MHWRRRATPEPVPRSLRLGIAALVAMAAGHAVAASPAASQDCLPETQEAEALEVTDPRTILLRDGRALRLAGIEPAGLLAEDVDQAEGALRDRLRAILQGVPIQIALISDAPDRYGRSPAIVVAEGSVVQETLLREGLAIAFGTDDPPLCFERFLAAEQEARRERRGIWAKASVASAFPDALQSRIGHFAVFEGRVRTVGNRRATTYLNFGDWWREDVTIEIAAADRKRFGGEEALAALAGARVRIRGFLTEKDGPMMIVRSPMQIEIVEPANDGPEIAP